MPGLSMLTEVIKGKSFPMSRDTFWECCEYAMNRHRENVREERDKAIARIKAGGK
jgi:hypothetical protein